MGYFDAMYEDSGLSPSLAPNPAPSLNQPQKPMGAGTADRPQASPFQKFVTGVKHTAQKLWAHAKHHPSLKTHDPQAHQTAMQGIVDTHAKHAQESRKQNQGAMQQNLREALSKGREPKTSIVEGSILDPKMPHPKELTKHFTLPGLETQWTAHPNRPGWYDMTATSPELNNFSASFDFPNKTIHAHSLFPKPESEGRGFGKKMLNYVQNLANEHGFEKIKTLGGQGSSWYGSDMTGYRAWPKYGFDGILPATVKDKLPPYLAAKNPQTIQQLHALPGGANFWFLHGEGSPMELDLTNPNRRYSVTNEERQMNYEEQSAIEACYFWHSLTCGTGSGCLPVHYSEMEFRSDYPNVRNSVYIRMAGEQ